MSTTRVRVLIAIAIAAISGGCIEYNQPPPGKGASATAEVVLSDAAGIVARHVTWSVTGEHGRPNALYLSVASPDPEAPLSKVRVLLVPDGAPNPGSRDDDGTASGTRTAQLLVCQGLPCAGGAMAIVRFADPVDATGLELPLTMTASVMATTGATEDLDKFDVAVSFDGDTMVAPAPTMARIEVRQTAAADADHSSSTMVNLHVEGAALGRGATWPLVGELVISLAGDPAVSNRNGQLTELTLGPSAGSILIFAPEELRTQWLGWCSEAVDCDIPITLAVRRGFGPTPAPDESPGPTRSFIWTIEARLEAFDGRTLPADALTLTSP